MFCLNSMYYKLFLLLCITYILGSNLSGFYIVEIVEDNRCDYPCSDRGSGRRDDTSNNMKL